MVRPMNCFLCGEPQPSQGSCPTCEKTREEIECQYCLHKNEDAFKGKCPQCNLDPMQYLEDLILEDSDFMNSAKVNPRELKRAFRECNHEYGSLREKKHNLEKEIKKLRQLLKEARNAGRPNIGI